MVLNKNWEKENYEFMEEITGQVFSVSFRQARNINHDKTQSSSQMNRVVNSRQSDFNESNN